MPHEFSLKRSFALFLILLVLHLGALVALFFASINLLIKMFFGICIFASFIFYHKKQCQISKVIYRPNKPWKLISHAGQMEEGELLPDSFRIRWIVILNFKKLENKGRVAIVILPDALSFQAFRQLRVLLWQVKETL